MTEASRRTGTAAPLATRREERLLRLLAVAGLAVAVFVRVFAISAKPFWADEAWMALLVRAPLAEILATRSPAPVGFLLAVKAAALLPGPPEVVLRLVPLLAGIATVILLAWLARALGASLPVQAVTIWLAAGLPALVYYSRELKHYGTDLLLGTAVALLAVRLFGAAGSPGSGRGAGAALPWVAAAAPWFSFGALFPVAATFLWGWCTRWRSASAPRRRLWTAATACWILSLATAWLLVVRHQSANPKLRPYWTGAIPVPALTELPTATAKAVLAFLGTSGHFLFPGVWPLAAILAAFGLWRWGRPGRAFLLWWIPATVLLTAGAAASGRYVVSTGRLLLFGAPLFLIPAAAGLVDAGRLLRSPRVLPLALAIGLSGLWSYQAVDQRLHAGRRPRFHFDRLPRVEPMIAAAESRRAPGEPVFVTRRLVYPFGVYARGRLAGAFLEPRPRPGASGTERRAPLREWLAGLRGRGWILLAPKDRYALRAVVAKAGCEVRSVAAERGVLLWEIARRGPPGAPP